MSCDPYWRFEFDSDIRVWAMIIIEDFNLTVILGYELRSLLKILIWLWF